MRSSRCAAGCTAIRLGERLSKREAASWAQHEFPQVASLIRWALAWRQRQRNLDKQDGTATVSETRAFLTEMAELALRDATCPHRGKPPRRPLQSTGRLLIVPGPGRGLRRAEVTVLRRPVGAASFSSSTMTRQSTWGLASS